MTTVFRDVCPGSIVACNNAVSSVTSKLVAIQVHGPIPIADTIPHEAHRVITRNRRRVRDRYEGADNTITIRVGESITTAVHEFGEFTRACGDGSFSALIHVDAYCRIEINTWPAKKRVPIRSPVHHAYSPTPTYCACRCSVQLVMPDKSRARRCWMVSAASVE